MYPLSAAIRETGIKSTMKYHHLSQTEINSDGTGAREGAESLDAVYIHTRNAEWSDGAGAVEGFNSSL